MASRRRRARIYVLAGVNGAGKSSLLGETVRALGGEYYNPDQAARELRRRDPSLSLEMANSLAWQAGVTGLRHSIAEGLTYAFETTLGAETITGILLEALAEGHEVSMLYIGLEGPELHLARVRARVAAGGHDIPEARIRERYDRSRANLLRLLPHLTALRVFDNSTDAAPAAGVAPAPHEVLEMDGGRVRFVARLESIPGWAKPIVLTAMGLPTAPPHPARRTSR